MKLKKFNRSTQGRATKGVPAVTVSGKGLIRVNTPAQELLALKSGDKINLFQDEERPVDWFIEKTGEEGGLIMRSDTSGGLICNAALITSMLLKSIGANGNTVYMLIAQMPIEDGSPIHAILTSSAH